MILSLSFACSHCRYVWINTWLLESFYCNKCGVAHSNDIISLHLCPASSTCDVCEWGALKGGAHGLRGGEDNSMEDSSMESHTALKWDQRKEIMWITQTHFLFIFNISVLFFTFFTTKWQFSNWHYPMHLFVTLFSFTRLVKKCVPVFSLKWALQFVHLTLVKLKLKLN